MAAVTGRDIPTETAFFNDLWKVVKATIAVGDDEDYWKYVVGLIDRLMARYPGNLFAREMTMGYLGYLEKENERRKTNDTKD